MLSKGLSRVFSNTTVRKHQFLGAQLSLWSSSHIHAAMHDYCIALTRWTSVGKVISLLFNILSGFVIAILPRSKCLLISWLQSLYALILEPKKIKSDRFHIFSNCLPDPERWYGVGGGKGVHVWELMYTRSGFMSMYGKTNTVL